VLGRLEAQHEEWQRDEGLGEHHGHGREGDAHPEGLERGTEQSTAPERREQSDSADHRGQHQRQEDQRSQDALARKARAREHQREGHPEQNAERGAGDRCTQAQR
jgi:hypothetical protein